MKELYLVEIDVGAPMFYGIFEDAEKAVDVLKSHEEDGWVHEVEVNKEYPDPDKVDGDVDNLRRIAIKIGGKINSEVKLE